SAQTVTLAIRCIRVGVKIKVPVAPGLGVKVPKTTLPGILIAPGSSKKVKLTCPAGSAPTGAGYDVQPADQPRRATGLRGAAAERYPLGLSTRLTQSMPVHGGWQFTVRDSGTR